MGADRGDHGMTLPEPLGRHGRSGAAAPDLPAAFRVNVLSRSAGRRRAAPRGHRSDGNAGRVRAHVDAGGSRRVVRAATASRHRALQRSRSQRFTARSGWRRLRSSSSAHPRVWGRWLRTALGQRAWRRLAGLALAAVDRRVPRASRRRCSPRFVTAIPLHAPTTSPFVQRPETGRYNTVT